MGDKEDVFFIHEFNQLSEKSTKISKYFNLLRCFKVDVKCFVQVFIGGKRSKNSWVKDFDCKPGIWYNFSENLIPNNEDRKQHKIVGYNYNVEEIHFEIMGIKLNEDENFYVAKEIYNPFTYGFRPYF